MPLRIDAIDHVQITVSRETEAACKRFYGDLLGLEEVPKPEGNRGRGGAWYQHGAVQLHLSLEDGVADGNRASRRHVCYVVPDLADAEAEFRSEGVEIIEDKQPIEGWRRFYVRDPGGNRLEIAERMSATSTE